MGARPQGSSAACSPSPGTTPYRTASAQLIRRR